MKQKGTLLSHETVYVKRHLELMSELQNEYPGNDFVNGNEIKEERKIITKEFWQALDKCFQYGNNVGSIFMYLKDLFTDSLHTLYYFQPSINGICFFFFVCAGVVCM